MNAGSQLCLFHLVHPLPPPRPWNGADIFKVDLLTLVNPVWKIPDSLVCRFVAMVTVNPIKLTMKVTHHMFCLGSVSVSTKGD